MSGPAYGSRSGRPTLLVVACYAGAGSLALATGAALGRNPLLCEGWMGARWPASLLFSLGFSVLLAGATIAVTPILVRRSAWGRALHAALRPAVHGVSEGGVFVMAVASSAGEELLFRGLLVPLVGVLCSSLLFGLVHQTRGPGRWGWMAWATVMGLLLAVIFAATGSLVGPLLAHAAINRHNLRYLRDTDPAPRASALGGLLR